MQIDIIPRSFFYHLFRDSRPEPSDKSGWSTERTVQFGLNSMWFPTLISRIPIPKFFGEINFHISMIIKLVTVRQFSVYGVHDGRQKYCTFVVRGYLACPVHNQRKLHSIFHDVAVLIGLVRFHDHHKKAKIAHCLCSSFKIRFIKCCCVHMARFFKCSLI